MAEEGHATIAVPTDTGRMIARDLWVLADSSIKVNLEESEVEVREEAGN